MAKKHGDWVQAGPAHQEGRQRPHGAARRPGDPSHQRPGGRLLPGADARRAGGAAPRAALGTRRPPRRPLEWMCALPFPALERDYEFVVAAAPGRISALRGPAGVVGRARHRRARLRTRTSSRSRCPTRTRCTHGCVGRGAYLCGPLARFNLNFDRLSPAVQDAARPGGADAAVPEPVSRPARAPAWRCCRRSRSRSAIIERYRAARRALRRRAACAPRHGLRRHRGAARVPLPPLQLDADGDHPGRPRSSRPRRRTSSPSRKTSTRWRRSSPALSDEGATRPRRAGHPQPRPVHLLRDALSQAPDGTRMTALSHRGGRATARGR